MKRIIGFLESREFELEIRWLGKSELGEVDEEENKLYVNPILLATETFLHEYYHVLYPDLPEEEVELLTKRKIARLKEKEIKRIGKYLLAHQFVKQTKQEPSGRGLF